MTEVGLLCIKQSALADTSLVADENDDELTLNITLIEIMTMALKRAQVNETTTDTKAATVAETGAQDTTGKETQVIDKAELNKALEDAKNEAAPETKEPEPEVAQEQQAEEPAAEPTAENFEAKQVAVKPESTVVTAAPGAAGSAMAAFENEMAAQGFEGMQLTGMSFDRVKLHEAQFLLGSEDTQLGTTIKVQIMSTRKIYVVRQFSGNGAEMFYSYDPAGKFKTDGSSAEETLAEWREDGYGTPEAPLEIKTYIEGMAMLVGRDDEYEQHMISLSIPPASRDRLAGAFAVGRQRFKCTDPANLIIECKVGARVGSGEEAFRPWIFKAVGLAE